MFTRRVLTLSLVSSLFGCSLLVDPRETRPRCAQDDAGPELCPDGLECRDGRCLPACGVEVCNDNLDNDCDGESDEFDPLMPDICGDGVDNDCDRVVDEGSDQDRDDYAWCGDIRDPDAGRARVDCDDYNSAVYPSAREICDGLDNDCDGVIDAADASLCEAGERCVNQRCVSPSCAIEGSGSGCGAGERCDLLLELCVAEGACGGGPCGPDEFCDSVSDSCKRVELADDGQPCIADAECRSGTCFDAAALRLASGTRVCGKACCDDRQCGEAERCFASGTGARSCLPLSMVPAGLAAQCASDSACSAPAICARNDEQSLAPPTFVSRPELSTSTCRDDELDEDELGERCLGDGGCDSQICVPKPGLGSVCSTACGSSSDCQLFGELAIEDPGQRAYCRYITLAPDDDDLMPDYAAVCVIDRGGETGPGGYGAACTSAADCLDRGCVGASESDGGRCTPLCCDDAQCGQAPGGGRLHCRPFAFGASYEMRCQL